MFPTFFRLCGCPQKRTYFAEMILWLGHCTMKQMVLIGCICLERRCMSLSSKIRCLLQALWEWLNRRFESLMLMFLEHGRISAKDGIERVMVFLSVLLIAGTMLMFGKLTSWMNGLTGRHWVFVITLDGRSLNCVRVFFSWMNVRQLSTLHINVYLHCFQRTLYQ